MEGAGQKPRLLLHCCCAPCASAVIERLVDPFDLTLFFYNPNIDTAEEYAHRAGELKRYVAEFYANKSISMPKVIVPKFEPKAFYEAVEGLEGEPEGGARCEKCIGLRLKVAAENAGGFDYFTTTLSISPHKNAALINRIGQELEADGRSAGAKWLYSDFKKQDGFKRSIELSREYCIYRQNYCGCVFAKR